MFLIKIGNYLKDSIIEKFLKLRFCIVNFIIYYNKGIFFFLKKMKYKSLDYQNYRYKEK